MKNENSTFNSVSPKYGSPLHIAIMKHKYEIANRMLKMRGVNPNVTNEHGSNPLHILFANFTVGGEASVKLGKNLALMRVNLNLIDGNGLSPIHVAIKRNQQRAL